MSRVVVIGGGVGGLTTAALLARAGLDVTVLEAHVYAGGCAGTFYHQGYRFDAGATLPAGFYPGGPMDLVGHAVGIDRWPIRRDDPAMVVHLPDGASVTLYGGDRRWEERRRAFGPEAEPFWRWQEQTSDALWDLALRLPAWPPQTPSEVAALLGDGLAWLGDDLRRRARPGLALDALRPVSAHLHGVPERLRLFVDAQLLIASQTTSHHTNALYGASALDLPRRGVAHAEGGMGAIAGMLVEAVRRNGGRVHLRQEATRIALERGRPVAVETKKGASFPADVVIVNLPPWNLARLLGKNEARELGIRRLRTLPLRPQKVWGAFMLYVGLDGAAVRAGFPLHHQVVLCEPMGNGNTVFLSFSPDWDRGRAPQGQRTLTLSTHTELSPWWDLYQQDREAYEARKQIYTDRVLAAAEVAVPGLRDAADLVLPGTPVTFQRFTRRAWGWVGGFPQTSLFRAWGPRLSPGLWLVGDSVFPGQSVPAVALGGLRVARSLLAELGLPEIPFKAPGEPQSAYYQSGGRGIEGTGSLGGDVLSPSCYCAKVAVRWKPESAAIGAAHRRIDDPGPPAYPRQPPPSRTIDRGALNSIMTTAIWWIRRDLRLADNQALAAALSSAGRLVPVFVLDPDLLDSPDVSEKRVAFLFGGLRQLDSDLRARGSRLVVRRGEPLAELSALLAETGAGGIFAQEGHTPYARARDTSIAGALPLHLTAGLTVHPPGLVLKADGKPYTVFTPFGRAWKALPPPYERLLLAAPASLPAVPDVPSLPIPDSPALPSTVPFPPGEAEAQRRLNSFVRLDAARIYHYSEGRNRLDQHGTSQLSPYLRFGMLSARQAVVSALSAIESAPNPQARKGAETWLNELIWREFYINILHHFPQVRGSSFRPVYDLIAWENEPGAFAAWCEGRTGYPVVDAAMRQLVETGWMHNRARMIVASFLVKDLLIDWRWGERFFTQHLVDGDLAANNGGWQWTAGTGTDAAPYFRIFNPVLQGKKYDPAGRYVRRWLPKLARVPDKFIDEPWKMPLDVQGKAGCRIGQDYPAAIVDHVWARERTLSAYRFSRQMGA